MGIFFQFFHQNFWREKCGPGRRIEHCPIGCLKCAKSPNPTLQPCWVHPTKSQNSLQEVDWQFSPPGSCHPSQLLHRRFGTASLPPFEPFGGKWVGRCRIFFLKPLWEPDLGWMHGMRQRNAPKMVLPSCNLGSQFTHMCVNLALLQNGDKPPEHKNCFFSIGTARHNVHTPRQGPSRVLATGKPHFGNRHVDSDGLSLWVVHFVATRVGAKKQHRKCSGVDSIFFDPVGAFSKSGGGPNHSRHTGDSCMGNRKSQ